MTRGATEAAGAGAGAAAATATGVQDALGWGAWIAAVAVLISLQIRQPQEAWV